MPYMSSPTFFKPTTTNKLTLLGNYYNIECETNNDLTLSVPTSSNDSVILLAGTKQIYARDGSYVFINTHFHPTTTNISNLGSASKLFKTAYLNNSLVTPLNFEEIVNSDMSGGTPHTINLPHTLPSTDFRFYFTIVGGHAHNPLTIELVGITTTTITINLYDVTTGNPIDTSVNNVTINVFGVGY